MSASACPDSATLRGYLLGGIDPDAQAAVAGHLDGCPDCLERLRRLRDDTDPLVARLRRPAAAAPEEPALRAALAKLQASGPADALPPGRLLREYRLVAKVGEGGMGAVYRAVHTRLDKEVALKVLARHRRDDPAARARFEREMRAVGRLRHPHIVQATDAGEADGLSFLVMEFVPGSDLAALVRRRGPLPVADACELARQAALALAHAHAHGEGLVHRDIKPSNLMLTPDGSVKLLDLGLALLNDEADPPPAEAQAATAGGSDTLTSPSTRLGTHDYMAPEQRRDPHGIDARADLYSLGCTLHYLLTGRPPWPGGSARDLRPEVPAALAELLRRLLADQPDGRPAGAAAAADALARFTAGRDLPALLGDGQAAPRRRRRYWLFALALAGLVAAIAAAFALRRGPGEGPAGPPVPADPPAGRLPMTPDEARALQQRWAEHLDRPVAVTNAAGMRLVLVPPGELPLSDGRPSPVGGPYYLGACEVTAGQFRAFVEATGHRTDAESNGTGGLLSRSGHHPEHDAGYIWRSPGFASGDDHPVVHVSWRDAEAFCRWLSGRERATYRLPTLREWRWACRAGAETAYYFGADKTELPRHAWYGANAGDGARPVGRLAANAWGLHDMLGNVREWCGGKIGPAGKEYRPACGGSYVSGTTLDAIHCDNLAGFDEGMCSSGIGFRILREP
jgi:formylglycine-generating enzyme required for sulfatase activity/tRNA A-37 threonylcarbamoyl transferase component Bud32